MASRLYLQYLYSSKASSTLSEDLPPPPGSDRQQRPTNHKLTGAQLCASTGDNHSDRAPTRPASNNTLSEGLPPPSSSGHQPRPTNYKRTGAQRCASTGNNHRLRAPTRRASSSTLSRDLPPSLSSGRHPRPTKHTRAGAQPYASTNDNHCVRALSCSTSGGTLINTYQNMGLQPCGSGQPLKQEPKWRGRCSKKCWKALWTEIRLYAVLQRAKTTHLEGRIIKIRSK